MALTLDTVRARMYGDETTDPIAGNPSEVVDSGHELLILGTNTEDDEGDGYRDHLRMVQVQDEVRLFSRQFNTDPWQDWGCFDDWDELHAWIYEL